MNSYFIIYRIEAKNAGRAKGRGGVEGVAHPEAVLDLWRLDCELPDARLQRLERKHAQQRRAHDACRRKR